MSRATGAAGVDAGASCNSSSTRQSIPFDEATAYAATAAAATSESVATVRAALAASDRDARPITAGVTAGSGRVD
jgi:hypothetical protein